ncbi:MAG: hypothetical protein KKB50_01915 [Planctomycetes bacterium]|nr:hypothetical protein [Planctomycetota bacterium]
MQQALNSVEEQRRDARRPAAFSFWFRKTHDSRHNSAWMLNTSLAGAAFLTVAGDAPEVGDHLALAAMHSANRLVREKTPALPPYARVVRVDDSQGATRRVAVQFESDIDAPLSTEIGVAGYQWAPVSPGVPTPPPLPRRDEGRFVSPVAIFR